MPSVIDPRQVANMRKTRALLLVIALFGCNADACAGEKVAGSGRPRSGEGAPAWVVQQCRPANGAEILGRFAGAGYWFYRSTGDFCYFDRRPGVL